VTASPRARRRSPRTAEFTGFPREGLTFLVELERNNDRDWFQANRGRYEQLLLEPARDFVEALGDELRKFAPGVNADPRVGGSIARINRDTRFSKDKRPYKNHLDLYFWEGSGKSRESPGYWFRLTPRELILAAGMHHFDRGLLERYRAAVDDATRGAALERAVAKVRSAGFDVGGAHLKRVPRGYNADHPRRELLLHDGLFAWTGGPVPREAHGADFPRHCAERYRALKPVEDWSAELVGV
jgi:uncharacterized protein (TIGR02453 family)